MMQREQILALLEQRGKGAAQHLDVLKEEVEKHPYFTAARLLYLKALQEAEQLSFEHELKRCAAHIPHREKLFEWVSRPLARPEESSVVQEATTAPTSIETAPTAAPQLAEAVGTAAQSKKENQHAEDAGYERPEVPAYVNDAAAAARRRVQEILEQSRLRRAGSAPAEPSERAATPASPITVAPPKPLEVPSSTTPAPSQPEETAPPPPAEKAALSSAAAADHAPEVPMAIPEMSTSPSVELPLEEKVAETPRLRFSEWLQQLPSAPSLPSNNPQDELVERFLKDPPSFRPRKESFDERNIAQESLKENPEIMTETLARLYTEQGHYQKAIQAYEIMSLRFPEKSSFFAGRIRELRKRLKEKK